MNTNHPYFHFLMDALLESAIAFAYGESFNCDYAEHKADKIRDMGTDSLIIKKGEHGALLFADGSVFSAPAYPLEDIQDPTGAGDSFAGGFIGYLSRASRFGQSELKRAMIYGSALASYVVEAFGPERILDLSGEDIGRRAREFRELTEIPELEAMPA